MGIRQETITTFLSGTVLVDDLNVYFISDERNRIVHLTFAHDGHHKARKMIASRHSKVVFTEDKGIGNLVEQAVGRYLAGNTRHLQLHTGTQLSGQATDFQKQVWQRISRIAYGRTRTYGDLARSLGNSKLARAVGQACHANPLALFVPCHRVVGASDLGGFAGGVTIKSRLLGVERASLEAGR